MRVTEGNAGLIFQLMEFGSKDWVSSLEGKGWGGAPSSYWDV